MTGHLFGDRYQVGDTLGFGGMSEVHRGRDLRLGRDVAVKVLRADLARDPSFQIRFRREAQNAASLNHPAIVAVYDTGETPGEAGPVPYIVMEYVDGETLRDLLKREGPLQPRRAMEIMADVCAALDFSHRHGIVHRDIKPANVMLTRAGAVKVMDFGIARAVADGQATVTATAAVIGTAQYLSPEQARGEAVDARSDVYATGCVLFELLTGAPPFTGDSPVAVAYQHVREDPKAPSEVKPGLPRELDAIVLKALNKNPLNRYQTAAEMRSDLVRALSGQAVHATPIMPAEERTELMRPGPMRVGATGANPAPLLAPPRRPAAADSWDEEEAPDRAGRVWGFVGIGALCLALLGGAIFLTLKLTQAPAKAQQVATPNVVNLSLADATKTLTDSGLVVGAQEQVPSTDPQKGKVLWSNPSQGQVVNKGTKVDLRIGMGVTSVPVPNLSGMTADEAKQALAKVGLKYAETSAISSDADKGKVLKQSPDRDAKAKPGDTVTVTIGKGPEFSQVDGVVGQPYDQAAAALTAKKLIPQKYPQDGIEPKDQVVKAMIGSAPLVPGQQYQVGTTVTLYVSNGNLFKMPSLQNLSVADAAAQLKPLGWAGAEDPTKPAFNIVYQDTIDVAQVDKVLASNPAQDAIVNKAAGITLTVGKKKQLVVPLDLAGKTQAQISDEMGQLGFSQVQFRTVPNPPTPADAGKFRAISAGPQPGTTVDFDIPIVVDIWAAAPPGPSGGVTTAGATPGPGNGNNPPNR